MSWEEAPRWLRMLVFVFRLDVTEISGCAVASTRGGRKVTLREAWTGVDSQPAETPQQ